MKKFILFLVGLGALSVVGYGFVTYYGLLFAKTVSGQVIGIERVSDPGAIINASGMGSASGPSILYSFAVAIQTPAGEIITGSSEDRQWAVVHKGQCAEAKFMPYPPWDLMKANTYHSVRLMRLFQCPVGVAAETNPSADATAPATNN